MYVQIRYFVMNKEDGWGCEFTTTKEKWLEYKKDKEHYECWTERA